MIMGKNTIMLTTAVLFGLLALTVSAGDFGAYVSQIKDSRGLVSDSLLTVSNCNEPNRVQPTTFVISFYYPRDECTGLMDVYYSHYEFHSKSYTEEKMACVIKGSESCDLTLNLFFGGLGTGTVEKDKWIRFRGVCRSNGEEHLFDMPVEIRHSPINFEAVALAKISDAESAYEGASGVLAECTCCRTEFKSDMDAIAGRLDSVRHRLASCDFKGIENEAISVKNDFDTLKMQIEMRARECADDAPIVPPGESEDLIVPPEQDVETDDAPPSGQDEPNGKPVIKDDADVPGAGAACPLGAALIMIMGGLGAIAAGARD